MPAKKKPSSPKAPKAPEKPEKPEKPVSFRLEDLTVAPAPPPPPQARRREEPKAPLPGPAAKPLPKLATKSILIAGGAGHIGSLLTTVCLAQGARVIVPSRSQSRLDTLRGKLKDTIAERLIPVLGDIGSPEGAEQIRDTVLPQVGRIDGVVASLGSFWEGESVLKLSLNDWRRILEDNLTAHFVVAQTFIPLMQRDGKGGKYVIITGAPGEVPAPRSAPISVAQAGLNMLSRLLTDDVGRTGIHIEEMIYAQSRDRSHWLTIDALMRETLHVLATGSRST